MIDIFIKSYQKDFKMLKYCLKSIEKNVTGYNKIVIVIPKKDLHEYNKTIDTMMPIDLQLVNEYGNGYLYQQYCKMIAHRYCESKFIMFVDSDCIFHKPIDITTLIKNDKPEILYTHYAKVGDAICWKEPTEKFLNTDLHYEYMRRLPLTYHKETLTAINNLYPNLEALILNSKAFSEFNVLGAWAHIHHADKYRFENTDNWQYVEAINVQLWSHCMDKNSELARQEYARAIETINKALDLSITEL